MSNELLNRAWMVQGLSGTEKLVLIRLADRANEQDQCFPGQTSLAKDCCLTTRAVRNAIHSLAQKGHLLVVKPATFNQSATYRITPTPPESGSGGERDSGAEQDSAPSGTAFRSPPELNSGPLRNGVPPNPNITQREPSENPQRVDGIAAKKVKPSADGFDAFWELYPNKVAKKSAEKAWAKTTDADRTAILLDLKSRPASKEWTKDGGQFIPHPATYLNGERWNDARTVVAKKKERLL
ncbi:MAG TPA: helix-turn-helix domain-containing protein [Verrucomicrobiota bacterium]|nr:helix-turn-helix domain-containing protein [Verrucomicrobiota bacterium]